MTNQEKDRRAATYLPPPPPVKPHGSHDNFVEMAAGGKAEQDALEARDERLLRQPDLPQQPADRPVSRETPEEQRAATAYAGQTDSAEGTGVGYAGEGGTSYGTQGATGTTDRLTDAPETTGRRAEMHTGDTRRTIDTERATQEEPVQEQEKMQQTAQSPASDTGGGASQRPAPVAGEGVIGGSKDEAPAEAGARALREAQGHVEPNAPDSMTSNEGGTHDDTHRA